jgi:hypothetical protein
LHFIKQAKLIAFQDASIYVCFMVDTSIYAVLTGDLVASQQAGADIVERAMSQIKASAQDLSAITDNDTRFTRFRGDGWQIILAHPGLILRACLILFADLKAAGIGMETRISAGIGPADHLGTTNLADATGPAFFISGNHLDVMPKNRRLFIAGGRQADQTWQTAIFDLVEWQSRTWTQAQAQAVAMALRQDWKTHQDIAARLGITRQAVQSRLEGAGFQRLDNALYAFEDHSWDAQ